MKALPLVVLVLLTAAACDGTPNHPTPPPPVVAAPVTLPGDVIGVYEATLSASSLCAARLPANTRERTYTATIHGDGRIDWAGPDLNPPPGHQPISSGAVQNGVFSFSIDFGRDPQSDGFNGLWDDFGDGTYLTISGRGDGTFDNVQIRGAFNGMFAFYEPSPANPNAHVNTKFCSAAEHGFRFVKR